MIRKKVFLSYTLKGNDMNMSFLKIVKSWIESQNLTTYIDILDNEYNAKFFQSKLLEELRSSDIFLIINTPHYKDSAWTNLELKEATKSGLVIIDINKTQLKKIIQTEDFNYLIENFNKTNSLTISKKFLSTTL